MARAGGVVSTTVMVWTQLVELRQASVAVQVRVIVFLIWSTAQLAPGVSTSELLMAMALGPLQLSVAVAMPVAAGLVSPGHSTVVLVGQVIMGRVVSTTVMV